jgi:23S rRNA-/tRNA-specific pseudouridylate synthase
MRQPVASWTVLTLIGRRRAASSFLPGSRIINSTKIIYCRCGVVRPFHQPTHLHHSSHLRPSKTIVGQSERSIIMEDNTRYCITTKNCTDKGGRKQQKWIRIAFDPQFDTTITHHNRALVNERIAQQQQQQARQSAASAPPRQCAAATEAAETDTVEDQEEVPASVLQYQRQLRKIQAADRASKTDVNVSNHLHTIYSDEHIVVTNKPSGILCVPGVNKNKSLLDLVFDVYGASEAELAAIAAEDIESERRRDNSNLPKNQTSKKRKTNTANPDITTTSATDFSPVTRDNMIVHRLDMDTSGIVIFARNRHAMSKLHEAFRQKDTGSTRKVYEALLVGWLDIDCWIDAAAAAASSAVEEDDDDEGDSVVDDENGEFLGGGEIILPLQRDHKHPPFMRVSTPHSEAEAHQAVADLNHAGYKKLIAKRPKPSVTRFRVVKHELWMGHKVTRVELNPGE